MFLSKPIDQLTETDLKAFIDRAEPEGELLDYKEKLEIGSDGEKKEFLKDVCSFANASGGYLIFGVEELRDSNYKKTGLPGQIFGIENVTDQTLISMLDILRAGIQPRIQGVVVSPLIGKFSKGPVIVMYIPRSWSRPHMVGFKNDESRFWSRHNNSKYFMNLDEIRRAFALSDSLTDRIAAFRTERVNSIRAATPPTQTVPPGKIILHLLPISAFDRRAEVDLTADAVQQFEPSQTFNSDFVELLRHSRRFNLNGFLIQTLHRNYVGGGIIRNLGYTQIYRNGVCEIVNTIDSEDTNHPLLPLNFGKRIAHSFWKHLELLRKLNVQPPLVFSVSLLDFELWRIYPIQTNEPSIGESHPLGENPLILPESFLQTFDGSSVDLIRPILDALWQAGGYPKYFESNSMKYEGE